MNVKVGEPWRDWIRRRKSSRHLGVALQEGDILTMTYDLEDETLVRAGCVRPTGAYVTFSFEFDVLRNFRIGDIDGEKLVLLCADGTLGEPVITAISRLV